MSLTKEQQKELSQLGQCFEEIEKLGIENNIDLDVFMTEYREDGVAVYATEKVSMTEKANNRKKLFEKAGKEKKSGASVKAR